MRTADTKMATSMVKRVKVVKHLTAELSMSQLALIKEWPQYTVSPGLMVYYKEVGTDNE